MIIKKLSYMIFTVCLLYFMGCASKNITKNNDFDIYQKIISSINQGSEKEAQDNLLFLMSNFPDSSLIEPSLLLLIDYYSNAKEYKIAKFYLKRLKEYSLNSQNSDYFLYLDFLLKYKEITSFKKTQLDLIKTMKHLEDFLNLYPDSKYRYNIATMHSHLYLTNILNNEYIANLYDDIGKDKSAKFYRKKNQNQDIRYIVSPDK